MIKTKIISMLCMLALLLSSNSVAVAKEKKENGSVTEAIRSADNFLTFMSKQGNEKWANCTLGEKKALFNLKNEIVAYYIEVERNNCDKGYIIISSDASYNVLEYSFDDSFIQEAKETVAENYNIDKNNQKIIYLGGIDYAIKGTGRNKKEQYFDITTSSASKVSKKDLNSIGESNEASGSDRPDGKSDITSPSKYESGYTYKKVKTITKGLIDYKVMAVLSDGKICAPTAATNYMIYWYTRNYKKYKNLCSKNWKNTFSKLFKYMKTDKTDGTLDSNVKIGYEKYIKSCKLNASATLHVGSQYGAAIVKEIDKDRPCHLILHNHNNYGNHSVLAVGYQKYTYKSFFRSKDQIYIRIADGWDKRPGRYVWGGCAGTWNYVSINMW